MGRSGGLREVLISALNTPTWTHQEEEHVSATPRPRVGPAVWGPPGMHRFLANNPPPDALVLRALDLGGALGRAAQGLLGSLAGQLGSLSLSLGILHIRAP